ncbi:MAG: Re/Si-specific NAD(P)(+) transhydrogenase subunit alpha [Myxococcota bacterium]|nr:Re/Si-specific NAD(P)(+) transhydrogenase subunit alpha [Myxococcota bacterium]
MILGVPRESHAGERRVSATPETVTRFVKEGFEVLVERGAGAQASFPDAAYEEAGATLVSKEQAWAAQVVLHVNPPEAEEVGLLQPGATLISILRPDQNADMVEALSTREVTALALDKIPRISRAQKMDVLSSMANIAGYRAVIEASQHFGGFFGAQMTAAGKSAPAKVLVIGAGVAGLAAIGAARGLGATVYAFDVRPSVKEQVESLGGRFLTVELEESGEDAGGYAKTMSKEFIDAEMALFREHAPSCDVVITTALIPGRAAPKLWLADMVEAMKPGSVVVDLAAEQGGNCEGTVAGQVVQVSGVSIIGYTDLVSRLPTVASRFFSKNIQNLIDDLGWAPGWHIDHEDEAVRGALVLEEGESRWPPPKIERPPPPKPAPAPEPIAAPEPEEESGTWRVVLGIVLAAVFGAVGWWAPTEFVGHFSVFVLACFVGWQLIWNVHHSLHTPLMSVTNAISGIILVGGILQAGSGGSVTGLPIILAVLAIILASINIVGGFMVTHRMLAMFRKGD